MPALFSIPTLFAVAGSAYAGVIPRYYNTTVAAGIVSTASPAPADIARSTTSYRSTATSSLDLASTLVESTNTTYRALASTPFFSYDPLPSSSASQSSTLTSIYLSSSAVARESSRASTSDIDPVRTDGTTTLTLFTTVAPPTPSQITPDSGAIPANATTIRSSEPTTSSIVPSNVLEESSSSEPTRQAPSTPPSVTSSASPREGLFTYSPHTSFDSTILLPSNPSSSSSSSANSEGLDDTSERSSTRAPPAGDHFSKPVKVSDGRTPSSTDHPWGSGWHHPHNPFQYQGSSTHGELTTGMSAVPNSAQPSAYASALDITSVSSSSHQRLTNLPDVVMQPSISSSASRQDTRATPTSTSATIPGITIVPVNPNAVTMWMTTTVTEAGMTTTVSA